MSVVSLRHSRGLIWGALAAFVLFVTPAGLPAGAPGMAPAGGASMAAESGALSGFVYGKDVRTPVAGAIVKIRNIADMKEMASGPTDANGMYAIGNIPEGRYLMGVTSAQRDYNLEYALYVKGGELAKLSVSLAGGAGAGTVAGTGGAGGAGTGGGASMVAGAGAGRGTGIGTGGGQEAGVAATKKKGFFSTVAGRALVVAAVGVGLYFLIVDNGEPSPIR